MLNGRGEVLRSYALIMANTEYIQFFLTDVHVSVTGDTALVTCTENILSGGPAPEDSDELGPLVGQLVVATNVFRRTPEGWKLWSHHASPVLAEIRRGATERATTTRLTVRVRSRQAVVENHRPLGMGGYQPVSRRVPPGKTLDEPSWPRVRADAPCGPALSVLAGRFDMLERPVCRPHSARAGRYRRLQE